MALDEMVEEGEYVPPEPWSDLVTALSTAQSRYLFEKQQKTPQDRMDLILRHMSALSELIVDSGQPAPQGFGLQAPQMAPGVADANVILPRPDVGIPRGGIAPLPLSAPAPGQMPAPPPVH